MKALTLFVLFSAGTAQAADWNLRAGDEPLARDALNGLAGRTLTFYDDGQSRYSAGGSYSYTYSKENGGGTAFGTYHIAEDGSICTEFRNGFSRCDLFVHSKGRLVLIDEKGNRYPVRGN